MPSLSYNRVIIAGNLTRDPQSKTLTNDRTVCNFGLAVNRRYRGGDGEQKEETTFVDVEAWGRTAELVGQYLTKGRGALVEGRLKLDTWEKDGQRRSALRVVADSVQFLGGGDRDEDQGKPRAQRSPQTHPVAPTASDDEPPF